MNNKTTDARRQATIAISPAHTATNQGASRGRVSEYGLTSEIVGRATRLFSEAGHICHLIGSGSNASQIRQINKIEGVNFGFELHFNNMASRPTWNGGLCMHSGSERGQELASSINHHVCTKIRVKNRGIFVGHKHLDPSKPIIKMLTDTRCPYVIAEPCYLSNTSDFNKINTKAIAQALFDGCIEYWGSITK